MSSAGSSDRGETVGGLLLRAAEVEPGRRFVQCGGEWLSFGEVATRSSRLAAGLREIGVVRGDRVSFAIANREEFIISLFACALLGAVQVPLVASLEGAALRHRLFDSGSATIIADAAGLAQVGPELASLPELRRVVGIGAVDVGVAAVPLPVPVVGYEELASCSEGTLPRVDPSQLCIFIYTSGTTGLAKGCMLSHGYYTYIPRVLLAAGWFEEGDTIFCAIPLAPTIGQNLVLLSALVGRGAAVIEPRFDPATFMERARQTGATVIRGRSSMVPALLAQPPSADDKRHSIRQSYWGITSGDDQAAFMDRFGVETNTEIYGLTECWPTVITPRGAEHRPSSTAKTAPNTCIGKIAPDLQVRIADDDDFELPPGQVGEILVRPQQPYRMFDGYWNRPEATAAAFKNLWYHTGDSGLVDVDGYLYFSDRKKDIIERNGELISSIELETIVRRCTGVAEAAVHAVTDDAGALEIKVVVVAVPDVELRPGAIAEFLSANCVSAAALPRYVEVVDELPRNVNLKVLKQELRDRGVTSTTWDLRSLGLLT